jgi:muconolactone delta-isomerase
MAQFIALIRRNYDRFPEAEFTPELLEQEAQRARELYAAGTFRAMWSREDHPGAVILLEAGSLDEADAVLASLPLAIREMLSLDSLVQLRPYRGFGPRST